MQRALQDHHYYVEVWVQEKASLVWTPGWIVLSLTPILLLSQHDWILAGVTISVLGVLKPSHGGNVTILRDSYSTHAFQCIYKRHA